MVPRLCLEFAQRVAEGIINSNKNVGMLNYSISQSETLSAHFNKRFLSTFTKVESPPLDGPDGIFTSTLTFTNSG
jgi:hypothetical protein